MTVSGPARGDSRKPYDKRSAYERRAAKRRARVRRMREEGETIEAIARALGVSRPTVHRDLAALRDQDTEPSATELGHLNRSLNPAEPGSLRAAKHGARSERIVAPLAERKLPEVEALCAGMPGAAPGFAKAREVLARRLARAELVADYLERVSGGSPLELDGEPLTAANLELELLNGIEKSPDMLGLTPTSAARLGVDLARMTNFEQELEAAERAQRARERLDKRALEVDGDAEEMSRKLGDAAS